MDCNQGIDLLLLVYLTFYIYDLVFGLTIALHPFAYNSNQPQSMNNSLEQTYLSRHRSLVTNSAPLRSVPLRLVPRSSPDYWWHHSIQHTTYIYIWIHMYIYLSIYTSNKLAPRHQINYQPIQRISPLWHEHTVLFFFYLCHPQPGSIPRAE